MDTFAHRLFHVSDIHFGREDKEAVAWFAERVRAERPDAVVMTGDLTMRARSAEFAAAGEWLGALGVPVTVEVGNHDLPYFNPFARLFRPYRRYRAVERMIETPLELPGVSIVSLRTTARFQLRANWSKGYVDEERLQRAVADVAARRGKGLVLVACHHPLVDAGTTSTAETRGGCDALTRLARAGAHAVLSGHVHDPFDVRHNFDGDTIRQIGAGTLSERTRDTPPGFNELRITGGRLETIARTMDERPKRPIPVTEAPPSSG